MIRVLLAEDHAVVRAGLAQLLDRAGDIEVVGAAADGAEAVVLVADHTPDVILMDLSMPVMDGWRFRAEQQRLPDDGLAGTPVVVLSALNDARRHAETLGAADLIPKPIDFDRLVTVVRGFCQA